MRGGRTQLVFGEGFFPPRHLLVEARQYAVEVARLGELAALALLRQLALVLGAQRGGRLDLETHVVGHRVEHDQRGFARHQTEGLADAADLAAVFVVIGLQLGHPQAGPLLHHLGGAAAWGHRDLLALGAAARGFKLQRDVGARVAHHTGNRQVAVVRIG